MASFDGGACILLASGSPRRSQLLSAAGFDFEKIEPGLEPALTEEAAEPQCVDSATKKARGAKLADKTGILLAVDTVVSVDGRALGKARDRCEAASYLDLLCDREHDVLTAHAHAHVDAGECGQIEVLVSRARVYFAALTEREREAYLDGGDWCDKAGAYGIQSDASAYARLIAGDVDTVIGLSLRAVRQILTLHS